VFRRRTNYSNSRHYAPNTKIKILRTYFVKCTKVGLKNSSLKNSNNFFSKNTNIFSVRNKMSDLYNENQSLRHDLKKSFSELVRVKAERDALRSELKKMKKERDEVVLQNLVDIGKKNKDIEFFGFILSKIKFITDELFRINEERFFIINYLLEKCQVFNVSIDDFKVEYAKVSDMDKRSTELLPKFLVDEITL